MVWNITYELIESQVDSKIPQPKVTPAKVTERTKRNARVIEAMLKCQNDRLPTEYLNDEDERTVRIMGGSGYLIEWDNFIRTHDTVGDISIRLINATQIYPQHGVTNLDDMDYFFVTFENTKSRIKEQYGKDVTGEGLDPQSSEADPAAEDLVTQVVCYYKNKKGGVGCFSWVGDVVLIDDDDYEARKDKICAMCGATKPQGENRCICGSTEWERRPKDFEYLTGDVVRSDGSVIPGISPQKDEDGNYIMEDYQEVEIDPQTGYPVFELVFDDMGMPIGERPKMVTKQRVKMGPTKLPYYYPRKYPLVLRKNVSATNKFLGASDCDAIRDFQDAINKILSKVRKKAIKAGTLLTKPEDLRFEFSDEDLVPLNVRNQQQISMITTLDLKFNLGDELAVVDRYYAMAKSVLGITDSYQGKPDTTAVSGAAKEAQIAQAAARQRSKRVMKNAAWADRYEMMFKFMLAYSDEPRRFTSKDENGEQIEVIFNRYDFLEQDDFGNWFYNDEYLFSVDESGIDETNKQLMLEDLRTDLSIGAYGPIDDPETMLAYWKEKEAFGYPNAARNVKRWEKKVEERKQQLAMQQGVMPSDMPVV